MADKDLRVNLKADDEITPAAKKAKASLDAIPDSVDVKVEATGIDALSEKLGALPGVLGDIGGMLGGGGAVAGGLGVAAGAANDLAQGFADAALEARVTADLTGATIEDASRLQAVWKQSGADINDLNDVLLQMNGVLQTAPEKAAQLGINLKDGSDIGSRFVEVIGKIQSSTLGAAEKAQLMAELFGEEGVRQVAKLTASIDGPLSGALEDVSEAQIIDPEEEQRAKDLTAATKELGKAWADLKMTLGELLLEPVTNSFVKTNAVVEGLKGVLAGDFWDNSGMDAYAESLGEIGAEFKAADFAGGDFKSSAIDATTALVTGFAPAMIEAKDAAKDYTRAIEEGVDAATAYVDAINGMADARRASVDSAFAARDADRAYIDQLIETETHLAEHPELVRENAAALDDLALAAGKNADAQAQMAIDQAAAAGKTLDAAGAQAVWNRSMVNSAKTTSGPMHDAIVNYVAAVNGIPPEKVSEILANPDYATIEAASAALTNAARDRDAEIRAEAVNVPPVAYALDQAARPRTAVITAQLQGQRNLVLPPSVSGAAMPMTATATGPAAYAAPVGYTTVPTVTRATVAAPTLTFNIGVMGNRFDSQRAVTKALRAHQRLNGVRP